jgi:uncharacterized repeat protein (TIGR03803 family)
MNNRKKITLRICTMCFGIALGALVILSFVGVAHTVRAQNIPSEKVILNLTLATGFGPTGVINDPAGNLYVGNAAGGSNNDCRLGCGNVLKVSPSGQSTELYAFSAGLANEAPGPTGLVRDKEGKIYGATAAGGTNYFGSVFGLAPSGAEKTLHNFPNLNDGRYPDGGLTMDSAGNLYGVTYEGGGTGCEGDGCGVAYKVTLSGTATVLYSFTGGTDGAYPAASPIVDASGNLYGTATVGGNLSCPLNIDGTGCGTVWKLDTSGNFSVLYAFTGTTDGAAPYAGLVMDSSANLYGAAAGGGNLSCAPPNGCGTIFEINFSGNFSVLYSFAGGANDGAFPRAALVLDSAGNMYGTTEEGGDLSCSVGAPDGCGVVFKLTASGSETILHAFAGGTTDGAQPIAAALSTDGKGNLYGTTGFGGSANGGVIFAVKE